MRTSTQAINAAADALRALKGTYIARHAMEIASAAVQAPDEATAIRRVNALVYHTSVGRRRFAEWAKIARAAADAA